MKKFLKYLAIVPIVLIVLIVVPLLVLPSILTPEFIVKQIESNLNARAHLKEVNIGIFSAVSGVELIGFELGRRDEFANKGTPLAERTPLLNSSLGLNKIEVKLSFLSLLAKKVDIRSVTLYNPDIKLVLFENGSNSLSPLFRKPLIVNGEKNPQLTEKEATEVREEDPEKSTNEPLNVKDIPVGLGLEKAGIEKGKIAVQVKKTGQNIYIYDLDLLLKNLEIDPLDLVKKNNVDIILNSKITVENLKNEKGFDLTINSKGSLKPFVPETGLINPALAYTIIVEKGSMVDLEPLTASLFSSQPLFQSLNLKNPKWSGQAKFKEDCRLSIGYYQGVVSFLEPAKMYFENYDLLVEDKAKFFVTNQNHSMNAKFLAHAEESKTVVDKLEDAKQKSPEMKDTIESIQSKLVTDNQFQVPFRSQGSISNPSIELVIELPSLTDAIKGKVMDELNKKMPAEMKGALDKLKF